MDKIAEPGTASSRRRLIVLGFAALALPAVLVALVALVALVGQRWADLPEEVPFPGWQVDLTEAAAGVLLLVAAVRATRTVRSSWRALAGSSPYRRIPLYLAVLPGLALGGVVGAGLTSAVGWASDRTDAAHRAQVAQVRWEAAYRQHPLPVPDWGTPATPALAALLLRAPDLGPGWYQGTSPTTRREVTDADGQLDGAGTWVNQSHWVVDRWQLDHLVLESVRSFRTPAQAGRYAARLARPTPGCDCTAHVLVHDGVRVAELATHSRFGRNRTAVFVLGREMYLLRISDDPTPADLTNVLGAALRTARAGR